jgi:hypothetical protein
MFRLSEVQVHAPDHDGNQVPEVCRGRIREAWQHGQGWARASTSFLRLLAVSRMRFHYAVYADAGTLPEVRRAVYRGEKIEDRRRAYLSERGLRLGAAGSRTSSGSSAGAARRAHTCGREALTAVREFHITSVPGVSSVAFGGRGEQFVASYGGSSLLKWAAAVPLPYKVRSRWMGASTPARTRLVNRTICGETFRRELRVPILRST